MHHCCHFQPRPLTRRQMLLSCMSGFGAVAFAAMARGDTLSVLAAGGGRTPAARRVIFLYMDGGPSQIDTFDPKPALEKWDGKPFPLPRERTQFNMDGNTLASPWKFAQHGQSGLWVSDLFPHVATCADELCLVRSMTSKFSEHTNANYFLHTGAGFAGRPSMGAWTSYGLGNESHDLPGFVVLNGGLIPPGGIAVLGNGFLPATHQASLMRPEGEGLANLSPPEGADPAADARVRQLAAQLDGQFLARSGGAEAVESAIANCELAFRMQTAVPELMELVGESESTKTAYGLDHAYEPTRIFARQCLLARRLAERGVRFIELTCPVTAGNDRWDQHGNLRKGHEENSRAVDQPIAALLKDLRARGMLDDTLVVWAGEFGRTPFAQGTDGRDHNPFGFSIWMAGGGVRGGSVHGATDDLGYKAVDQPVEVHDLHATMLHLLGVDHTQLTHLFGGRQMRLTDVHGKVQHHWLAAS